MVTARLDIRLYEDSTQVIAEYERVTVKADIFDQFMKACDEAKAPNKVLREAAAFTERGKFK